MPRKTSFRRAATAVLALAVLGAAGALTLAFWPTRTEPPAAPARLDDPALIEQGKYLAIASDCIACHTAKGGKPFAGGLPMETPLGTLFTTNITPDPSTGIGRYSLDDFDRALRHGILPNGDTLYPAMPYPSYARLRDADVAALYAYFLHGVAPVEQANTPSGIPWPLSARWPLALWRKAFGPGEADRRFDAAAYPDERIARGAYLVQGAGHCGACHTPRDAFLREKGLDENSPAFLSGGPLIDGWVASNLRGDTGDGLGGWTEADIVATLRTGRTPHRTAISGPPMKDVVVNSTQYLSDDDLHAIAAYLKTLPAAGGQRARHVPSDDTARALKAGESLGLGGDLYVDNCAACHRTDGRGDAEAFPTLAGNSTVLARDPSSVIRLILGGEEMPATRTRPSNLAMPGFAWRLDDAEVAALSSFIRGHWGNDAPPVSAREVEAVRADMAAGHDAHRLTRTAP